RHVIPGDESIRQVNFITMNPAVSAWSHWVGIAAQEKHLQPSSVSIRFDPGKRRFVGKTENVARIVFSLDHVSSNEPLKVELDGQKIEKIAWPQSKRLWLEREEGNWFVAAPPPASLKGPHRYGPFREAFRNRMLFVYGTKGNAEEKAWAFARARYDAETFWYRGNGSVDVIPDTAFVESKERDRNVILYGNADTNGAWKGLLGDSPVQVRRDGITFGEKKIEGKDLACLFLRPRPESDVASVGVVSGTGIAGMRLTDRMPYFISGAAFPDCLVVGPEMLTKGSVGVRVAGFFGHDWSVTSGEFVWGK